MEVTGLAAFSLFNLPRRAWGDEFEYFLASVSDGRHVQRALTILEQFLASLATGSRKGIVLAARVMSQFPPWMALVVLPHLTNSFTVSVVSTNGDVTWRASRKAFLGCCSYHRILLARSARHPSIVVVHVLPQLHLWMALVVFPQ